MPQGYSSKLAVERPLEKARTAGRRSIPIDLLLGAAAVIVLPLALRRASFPAAWDWKGILTSFAVLAVQASCVAAVLAVIQSPRELLGSFWREHWQHKPKLAMLAIAGAALLFAAGPKLGGMALLALAGLMELLRHNRERGTPFSRQGPAIAVAAVYLLFGLVLVFTYTNIIVRFRFYGQYDAFFNHLDALLFRTTVPALGHAAAALFPQRAFSVLNAIYYGMFAQIGAALVICAVSSGMKRAVQFVGTVLVSYYLTLALFYWFPSHGPYYLCVDHFHRLAYHVASYTTQQNLLANAQYLWQQRPVKQVPMGYYIAFPCMHVAQPLIVLWFLRRWKRIVAVLVAYDVLLIAAIILLEWHYIVDLPGGLAVAALAIVIAGRAGKPQVSFGYEATEAIAATAKP